MIKITNRLIIIQNIFKIKIVFLIIIFLYCLIMLYLIVIMIFAIIQKKGNIMSEIIENLIYEIRGVQVMLDSDLAKLYECTNGTKDINKAVKRNIEKFPSDFYFQLSNDEKKYLWFQIGTANKMSRTNPYVFTEQGVAMLSSVLHTKVANEVSIRIMRSFVKMRKYFKDNSEILINHENRILSLESTLDKFKEKELNKIFFEGELYDAYSLLIDIFNKSKEEIIIIDNYAGKELLDLIKKLDKRVIIVSKNIDEILKNKYSSQYNNVTFIKNESFHDRFIIIDRKELYSSGSSFKDLGKKCFSINRNDTKEYLYSILKSLFEDC